MIDLPFLEILGLALLVGLIDLDTTAAGLFMISRPIVAGPLLGLVMGDVLLGLQIGALLELLWVGRLPLGAHVPSDVLMACSAAVYAAVKVSHHVEGTSEQAAVVGILWAMPLGFLGGHLDQQLRKMTDALCAGFQTWKQAGDEAQISLALAKCLLLRLGAVSMVVLFLFPGCAWTAVFSADLLYHRWEKPLEVTRWLLPAVGAAGVFRLFTVRGGLRHAFAGFIVTAALGLLGVPGIWVLFGAAVATAFLVAEPLGRIRERLARRNSKI